MERPSIDLRSAILNAEIRRYIADGYRVHSATNTTAQLVKPKKFSFWGALAWFVLTLGAGLPIYIIYYYLWKKDRTAYIEVDETGRTTVA